MKTSVKLYRLLLRFYPAEFCNDYAEQLDQAFRDLMRDAVRKWGWFGVATVWAHVLPDLILTAIQLHRKKGDVMRWQFRLEWIVACGAGAVVGQLFLLLLVLARVIPEPFFPESRIGFIIHAAVLGFVIGLLQSRILRGGLFEAIEWALFSAAGLLAGSLIMWTIAMINIDLPYRWLEAIPYVGPVIWFPGVVVLLCLPGTFLGLMQSLVLRHRSFEAAFWILANAIAVPMAILIISAIPGTPGVRYLPSSLLFGHISAAIAAGCTLGLLTATPLERILRGKQIEGTTVRST